MYMNESCHVSAWVASHMWMSYVTCVHDVWVSHVTYVHEPCHTYKWVMSHMGLCVVRVTFTHHTETHVWHNSFICVTRLMHICDMTHSYIVWCMLRLWIGHVNYLIGSCQKYEWVVSHVCEWGMSDIGLCVVCVTLCDMLRVWMSHVAYPHESCHLHEWVISHIYIGMNESFRTYKHRFLCCACYIVWRGTSMNESYYIYAWVASHI